MTATMAIVAGLAMPLLALAILLALYRLGRGPSGPDRVVALDLTGVLSVGVMGVFAIQEGDPVFLDVALVTMLIHFLATLGFAHHLGRKEPEEHDHG